jgi:hypothetical protein
MESSLRALGAELTGEGALPARQTATADRVDSPVRRVHAASASAMKGLVVYAKADLTQARADYIDERYFRLLARRFRRAHPGAEIHLEEFDEDDSAEFLSDIEDPAHQGLDVFAYIGHGGQNALYSADIGSSDAPDLAAKLSAACNNGANIIFYACNAGRLNESLLRTIHLSTLDKGFWLYGHSTAGRAGNNPNKTVFPPDNGAMLIDEALGDLAGVPLFQRAWNYTMGNEADDLWATFFLLTYDELARRACRSVLRRATASNRTLMKSLGWQSSLARIHELLEVSPGDEEGLAIGIANWQFQHFENTTEVDGIMGRRSWQAMQSEL